MHILRSAIFGLSDITFSTSSHNTTIIGYFIFRAVDNNYEKYIANPLNQAGITILTAKETCISSEDYFERYQIPIHQKEVVNAFNFAINDIANNNQSDKNRAVLNFILDKAHELAIFEQLSLGNQTILLAKPVLESPVKKISSPLSPINLITHCIEGDLQPIIGQPKKIDEQHSAAIAYSVWNEGDGVRKPSTKPSDDKIITGYHSQGLPFLMTIDGFYGGETQKTHRFIDSHVTPLMNGLAVELADSNNANYVIKKLIKTIYQLRATYAKAADFTLSLVIVYQQNHQLYAAGFGIGDTGVVYQGNDGWPSQLVANTCVERFKDAFDNFTMKNIDLAIERNTVFHTAIERHDEIVGYTFLPDSMEMVYECFETQSIGQKNAKEKIEKKHLNFNKYSSGDNLYTKLVHQINNTFSLQCERALAKRCGKFGDDCAVGQIVVPSETLQQQLKQLIAIKVATITYLDSLASKGEGTTNQRKLSFKSYFHQDSHDRLCAQAVLEAINSNQSSYESIINLLEKSFRQANLSKSSYHGYMRTALEFDVLTTVDEQAEDEFGRKDFCLLS